MNIVEFIETCADEDLRVAMAAEAKNGGPWLRRGGMVVGATQHRYTDGDLWDNEGGAESLSMFEETAVHVARHHPLRAFAEVSAIRTVVADRFRLFETVDGEWGCGHDVDAIRAGECADNTPEDLDRDSTFRALARIWGDRPESEPRWLEDA